MDVKAAWNRGWQAHGRYLWLALLPLAGDLLRLGLGYLGLPAWPPPYYVGSVAQQPQLFLAFIPDALPSIQQLRLPMVPALHRHLAELHIWELLAVALLPVLLTALKAVYLGLLAEGVAGRPQLLTAGLRRAGRAFPGLLVITLYVWLVPALLPARAVPWAMAVPALAFALLSLTLVARDLPLLPAMLAAPGLLWSNFSRWLELAFWCMLWTALGTFAWGAVGRLPWLGLLLVPFLATPMVAAGLALLAPEAEPNLPPASPRTIVGSACTLALLLAGAWLGGHWIGQWQGWLPTRAAALPADRQPFGEIIQVVPEPGGNELVLFRPPMNAIGVAELRQSRWGWQLVDARTGGPLPTDAPVEVYVESLAPIGPDYRLRTVAVARLLDPQIAYLELQGRRYPVPQGTDDYVVLSLPDGNLGFAQGWLRALDKDGNPLVRPAPAPGKQP